MSAARVSGAFARLACFGIALTTTLHAIVLSPFDVAGQERDRAPHWDLHAELLGKNDRLLIGASVTIGERSHAEVWNAAFDAIFDAADRNADDELFASETVRLATPLRIRLQASGMLFATDDPPIPFELLDVAPADDRVTREEVRAYYASHDVNAVHVVVGVAPATDALNRAILTYLDRDSDGAIVDSEWSEIEAAFRPADADEDGVVLASELLPLLNYRDLAPANWLRPLREGLPDERLESNFPMVAHPVRIGSPTSDVEESVRDADQRSVVELRVAFPDDSVEAPKIAFAEASLASSALEIDGTMLSLRGSSGSIERRLAEYAGIARRKFHEADDDRNERLAADELQGAAFVPLRLFAAVADRDEDGELTLGEWDDWLELQSTIARAHVQLSIIDFGRGLFELLDEDGSGGLAARELRSARERLTAIGALQNGKVDADRLPRLLVGGFGQDRLASDFFDVRREGPDWFLAMDRNEDGDLSEQEFVGPADRFRDLDADGDGLMTLNEATGMN